MKNTSQLLCIIVLFYSQFTFAKQCDINPNQLIAKYQIDQSTELGYIRESQLELYRFGEQVGHFFPQQRYGDWWSKTQNNQLMLTRYFPNFERSIEYQSEDLNKSKRNKNLWVKKRQLISNKLLSKMQVIGVEGQGCYQVELLKHRSKGKTYHARWLPKLQLVERLEITKGTRLISRWRMSDVQSANDKIKNYVAEINSYKATDYADIGDNENDPFLAKMINQGFSPIEKASAQHHH